MLVLGIMSGTSLDGIDCALTRIEGQPPELAVELLSFASTSYTPAQRRRLARLCEPETSRVDGINGMNFQLAHWFAEAAGTAVASAGLSWADLDLIASHGQTLFHAVDEAADPAATLQIGDPAVIAQRTGVTTVGNFRTADVALGGQGAPLVSYVDWLLWRSREEARAILNIGGIANLTYLPRDADAASVRAFDTGPGNLLLDYFIHRISQGTDAYDAEGRRAARGRIHEPWLRDLLADPYYAQPPPKTTGRERFGQAYGARLWEDAQARGIAPDDRMATLTALTVETIAQSLHRHLPEPPERVWVGGGGARNLHLMARLRSALDGMRVDPIADRKGAGDAKEALSFAVLGYETIHGRPGNLPGCTGAARPAPLGQIAPGGNFRALMRRATLPPVSEKRDARSI